MAALLKDEKGRIIMYDPRKTTVTIPQGLWGEEISPQLSSHEEKFSPYLYIWSPEGGLFLPPEGAIGLLPWGERIQIKPERPLRIPSPPDDFPAERASDYINRWICGWGWPGSKKYPEPAQCQCQCLSLVPDGATVVPSSGPCPHAWIGRVGGGPDRKGITVGFCRLPSLVNTVGEARKYANSPVPR